MPPNSTNSNNGSGTGGDNSEPTKNGMMDYVPYFGNNNGNAGPLDQHQMHVQPAQGPPYNNYDGLPRNGFVGATITPSDSTIVSELTEDIRTVDVINPPGLKPLTHSNIARMENGESDYTPKTDFSHNDPNDNGNGKDVEVTAWNAEGLNAMKNSKKHRSKMIIFGLLFLLIVIAAVALGIGLSQNNRNSSDESQLPDGGFPTLAPGETAAPTSPGETPSPTATPTPAPSEPGETPAPTEEATTATPVDVPTEPPVVAPTDAPVPAPTEAPVQDPTEAPVAPPTGGGGGCEDTVTTDKTCYAPGEEITATYNVCNPDPNGDDWIGLYRSTTSPETNDPRYWQTICGGSWCRGPNPYSNTLVMGIDTAELAEGDYDVYLLENGEAPPYATFAQTSIEISSNC